MLPRTYQCPERRVAEREGEYVCVWGQSRARRGKAGDAQEWFSERRASIAKKKSRTQMLWLLQLAGDWHASVETATPHPHPHMMRVMIVSNLSVEKQIPERDQLASREQRVENRIPIDKSRPQVP